MEVGREGKKDERRQVRRHSWRVGRGRIFDLICCVALRSGFVRGLAGTGRGGLRWGWGVRVPGVKGGCGWRPMGGPMGVTAQG